MRGESWKIVLTIFFLLAAIYYLLPTVQYLAMDLEDRQQMRQVDPDRLAALERKAIKLGLDLQGGMHVVLEVDRTELDEEAAKEARDRALQIIRNRVDEFGVSEPEIFPQGSDRIVVDLPALQDAERARDLIGKTAILEFKLLESPENTDLLFKRIDQAVAEMADKQATKPAATDSTALPEPEFDDPFAAEQSDSAADLFLADDSLATDSADTGKLDLFAEMQEDFGQAGFTQYLEYRGPDYVVLDDDYNKVRTMLEDPEIAKLVPDDNQLAWSTRSETYNGRGVHSLYLLKRDVKVHGENLSDAAANYDQYHKPVVDFTLDRDGARDMSKTTGPNIGKPLAIVLDGRVESAPNIRAKIRDKGQITLGGAATFLEARDLAVILRAGAWPAPMKIVETNVIGPTLGADSIKAGKLSAGVAMLIVLVFMLIYYQMSGLIADLLVVLNILFMMALLSGLHAALTLPGIAGIILTLGITVDASVLIFERIREELRTGKTVKAAIEAGYDRATIAIVDSNITTLIAAGVLYYFGTGPIRGFATTLGIGILCSLYTALIVGKTIFSFRRRAAKLSI
ncbi:MAG: protein translocase subunit SecD [bacterium]